MHSTALNITQEESENATITTTLHDLVEVLEAEVGPAEDPLIAEIVLDLVETGRIRFVDPSGAVKILWT